MSFDNIYPTLVNLRWYKLLLLCLMLLLCIHSIFAGLYYAGGPGSVHDTENRHSFLDCFFFSVQTMSTIGYGDLKRMLYISMNDDI
jgi:inward rectifier potassium channel